MRDSLSKILFLKPLLLATATPAFAIVPDGMTSLADSILSVFTGPLVRTILVIFLAACAVAYGFNKDNEKMKRNIIAIGIAIGVIVAAQFIVDAIWSAAGG